MISLFSNLKSIKYLVFAFLIACGGGGSDSPVDPPVEPEVIIPSNLTLNITIQGADATNPNGDGSGKITCTATATDAVKYGFRFGTGTEVESTTGNISHTYTTKGTANYTVYVFAYSKTNHSVNTSKAITIYVKEDSFDTLVFSDEFNTDGSPDSNKWVYDIGTGQNGWGNNELQYYTNRTDNVIVENGLLKIKAKRENYMGSEFTSTRMKSQGKFDFTYGLVEVRAKLPIGVGTWPAIWMLGSNFPTVGWPACGEIDIMEHVGKAQGTIHSSLHTPSSYGATQNTSTKYISDVSTAFHIYSMKWTSDAITFYIDDVEHYKYAPVNKTSDNWPYTANQFIILNVAMGGTFGGPVEASFTESLMEIDYVRVYQ